MRARQLRLLVLLALLLAGTVPPTQVQADYWHGEVFYYDACYTTVIGYFVRYCDNSTSSWGQTSAYSRENPFDCGLQ
jgi:hypothetical protein